MNQFQQGKVFSQSVELMEVTVDQLQPIQQANHLSQDGPGGVAHNRVVNVLDG
jgi:hypothetical protein